jgi:hypothetical protein
MPKDLKDFPRPPSDNGRGIHGSFAPDWSGGDQGYDFWINELLALGIKWVKVVDDNGNSIPFCEKLIAAGIFPIVRILRRYPPPNDTPEPNPGHIARPEEETIHRLIAAGVHYFETNNEPDRANEWKHNAMPGTALEAAKLVALNWLFDARFILEAGGLPGLPAISSGAAFDLMGALVALGRHAILLEGCWIAVHNDGANRPLDYPDHAINQIGIPITPAEYDHGAFSDWAWWNTATNRADTCDEINALRDARKNPAPNLQTDHACFREFEYYNALALKYLGRAIPIIGTEGGYRIGRRDDPRYPRVTPDAQRDLTVAQFDWMQRQAPDYFFAMCPAALLESPGREADAWHSAFWQTALRDGAPGKTDLPKIAIPGIARGAVLPVIDAVKQMPNLARRLPGAQPAPPPPVEIASQKIERPGLAHFEASAPPELAIESELPAPVEIETTPVETESEPRESPPESATVVIPRDLVFVPTAELEWDFRLDALNITMEPANVKRGDACWRLVSAVYEGPGESGETHHIFYTVLDEVNQPIANQRVWQGWSDNQTDAVTNERGQAILPLWQSFTPAEDEHGAYSAWVDGMASDRVVGLGLPLKRHVNFRLTWRRARR